MTLRHDGARFRVVIVTVSIGAGYDWRYLIRQTVPGAENYYLRSIAAGVEPAGQWAGRGAPALGLGGQVGPLAMEALYGQFIDPRDPGFRNRGNWCDAARLGRPPRRFKTVEERLARALKAEPDAGPERRREIELAVRGTQRQAVHFLDITFSVQKSVSVLHASFLHQAHVARTDGDLETAQDWEGKTQLVWEAVEAGNAAMLEYTQREAGYSRAGYHGRLENGSTVGQFVDAHDWIVASFRHHTSRCEEPQLHIHNAVLNRVQCPDGEWRTLDSRAVHNVRAAAGAIAERVTEEFLRRTLGVELRTRPDGKAREVVGVSQAARDVFSTRRRAITGHVAGLVRAWEQQYGRPPNALQLSRLSLRATLATRPYKSDTPRTAEQLVAQVWAHRLQHEAGQTLGEVAARALVGADRPLVAAIFDPRPVIRTAVEAVQATQATWGRYDLIRHLNAALPDSLGGLAAKHIEKLLEELADQALHGEGPVDVVRLSAPELVPTPAELRRASDGRSIYQPHTGDRYATTAHMEAEERLVSAAGTLTFDAMPPQQADALLAEHGLSGDQAGAVGGVLRSRAAVDVIVGPAGTGKSYTMAALADIWQTHRGPVVGLATARQAANVLADEGIPNTNSIAAWWFATHPRCAQTSTTPRPTSSSRCLVRIPPARWPSWASA